MYRPFVRAGVMSVLVGVFYGACRHPDFWGCLWVRVSPETAARIHPGMSPAEVVAIVGGRPKAYRPTDNTRGWWPEPFQLADPISQRWETEFGSLWVDYVRVADRHSVARGAGYVERPAANLWPLYRDTAWGCGWTFTVTATFLAIHRWTRSRYDE